MNLSDIQSNLSIASALLENIHVRGSLEINMMSNIMARVGEASRVCLELIQMERENTGET